jgi:hypothetical protein
LRYEVWGEGLSFMANSSFQQAVKKNRVQLSEEILARFFDTVYNGSVPELTKRAGLPYRLIYDIVYGRVHSISTRQYRILFGEEPPQQETVKVDGAFFRKMVDLWIYLNHGITKSDLSREFSQDRYAKRVDYRVFTGQTKTVDAKIEKQMEKKFLNAGIDRISLERWVQEYDRLTKEERIPYSRIRPALIFLKNQFGVRPTTLLRQFFDRYETGGLKSVSKKIYENTLEIKKKAEEALDQGTRFKVEKVKEEIYGSRKGYILYSAVEEELRFLQSIAKKSPKRYLGRSQGRYKRGGCKRIANWRADKIRRDCDAFIKKTPELLLSSLPESYKKQAFAVLLTILVARVAQMLSEKEGLVFEKKILTPIHPKQEYEKQIYGFTQFDKVPNALGMEKRAFDLMVAGNCEIFKSVGRYSQKWYLSDLYVKELAEKDFFDLISAKYSLMAKKVIHASHLGPCLN